ncbi:MarR family transcriptional regulator [Erythrobacter sp. Alg231-14]|uniref:MarR family transcriptional regulator n=1 Tax=Erythrobacter sp. Alg231-14 TaxID=1922225 RepID=UPI000D54D7B3
MTQLDYQTNDFSYDAVEEDPQDASDHDIALAASVAIFADRHSMRAEIGDDLSGAGFRTVDGGPVSNLIEGPVTQLGDVVMVDCPMMDATTLAALVRLDLRAAQSGAQLIVSTSIDALDDVFAALDQSDPQILVQPSRAERVLAAGRVLANVSNSRVREMTENDRLNLLHLSRQVEAIAQKLEGLSGHPAGAEAMQASLRAHAKDGVSNAAMFGMGGGLADAGTGTVESEAARFNSARPPLPDPRLVRQVIAGRQARAKFFDAEMFADPAWDMLLDLTAAHAEHSRVSVTSLCIAAAVPATTALRWIKQLVETGVFERVADSSDRRRAFIGLSENSADAMSRYFFEVETPAARAA